MSIEIKFDPNQTYQREAIDAVVDLFAGQEGAEQGLGAPVVTQDGTLFDEVVFGNSLALAAETLRTNLRRVQDRPITLEDGTTVPAIAESLRTPLDDGEAPLHFNVEMETGTGKTYVYVRTIAELHRSYGFRKFVIVVPGKAIREGVLSSLAMLGPHIRDLYDGLQYDYQVYDGKFPNRVRPFATATHLQIMVLGIDGIIRTARNEIFHRPNDNLDGYAPVDFIRACRPIVIMDEPQSLKGDAQSKAIEQLNGLFKVGYSATPPAGPHLVHRLTPVDAYNQRLVKRIGVYSLTKDTDLNEAYVEVTKITAKPTTVTATAIIHKATKQGTKPTTITLHKDDDLYEISGERGVYSGWSVEDIHADLGAVEFGNGQWVSLGGSTSHADEQQQRLMLRLAIENHFDKELSLLLKHRREVLPAPMKPLTLFFIERVADYAPSDAKLRTWFEQEYAAVQAKGKYKSLKMPDVDLVHDGYFAVDKKGKAKDTKSETAEAGLAYERIMKNKEKLLGFDEPLRFIFSHSALAEGWDNPNVFTICNLQEGKSKMRKRQQVGRGLRLPVMANGERCHIDDVNLLTVIARESFATFADTLQKEIETETGVHFTGRVVNLRDKTPVKLKDKVLASTDFVNLWSKISPKTHYRLRFSTDAIVDEAVRRINSMAPLVPVKFHMAKAQIEMSSEGLSGAGNTDLGEIEADTAATMPDVVGELCRRLPLSRATIVRILKSCDRLSEVKVNPAVFIDQVTDAVIRAFYNRVAGEITYEPTGATWSADLIEQKHQADSVAARVIPVDKSVTDHVICDSEVEETFAKFLDERSDIPLFLKLPDWFKIPTPLGNYNPDWAFVRVTPSGPKVHLVRETKGTDEIDKLQWESEGWKIQFGNAHFDALGVDYAFGHDPVSLIEPTAPSAPPDATLAEVIQLPVGDAARYTTHLPVFSLDAAAGYFGEGHDVEEQGWMPAAGAGRVDGTMFITRVVGHSMEPRIPDQSYCVFRQIGAGTRNGKTVLAQYRGPADPETGGAYTVKVYWSDKNTADGSVRGTVRLEPLNPDYEPIILTDASDDDVQIIAEFVSVLGGAPS